MDIKDLTIWCSYHNPNMIYEYNLDYIPSYINLFYTNDLELKEDNINYLNPFYSEVVTYYYVWKNNLYSKYVGFCHYRRFYDSLYENMFNDYDYIYYMTVPTKVKDLIYDKSNYIIELFEYLHSLNIFDEYELYKTFFSNNKRNLAWKISFITSWNNFTQFCNIFFGFLEYIFNNYKDINKYKDFGRDISFKFEIWTGIIISLLNGNKNNRIPKLNVDSLFTCSNDIGKIILWIKKNNRVTSTKYILTNLSEEDKQEIINRTTYLYFGHIMEPENFKFVTEKPKLDNIICLNDDEYIKCYDPMDFVNKKYTIEKI